MFVLVLALVSLGQLLVLGGLFLRWSRQQISTDDVNSAQEKIVKDRL